MINEILNILPDFREKVESKEISLCLLRNDDSPKAPVNGYNYIVSTEELDSPLYSDYNLGISLLGPKYIGDKFLCCIDIDGDVGYDKIHDDEQKIKNKNSTQKWFYQIIKEAFDKKGIKPLVVRTMSGGYHIYLYIYEHPKKIHGFSSYLYPKKDIMTMDNFKKWDTIFEENQHLNDFLNKPIKDNAIEIFSQKRMMVAPGSCIDGKYYTVSPDGAQSFSEIGELIDTNIYDFIIEALIENNFILNPDKPILHTPQTQTTGETRYLTKNNINKIANLIGNLYPQAGDQKHYCTLALGGYLATQNVAVESIEAIGMKIIEDHPNLFDNDKAFLQTLEHDSVQGVNGGEATGLKTLQDNLGGIIDRGILAKKMHIWTQSPIHSFYPNGEIGNEYTQVTMNFKYHSISKQNIVLKKKDSDFIPVIKNQMTIKHVINDIVMVNDISRSEKSELNYENPVYFKYTTRNETLTSPLYENVDQMFKDYKSIEGAHISGSRSVLELIFNEFEEFDLITREVGSFRPGIFLDPETQTLHRFIKKGKKIEELPAEKPSLYDITEGVKLLTKINENYPWQDDKFGIFIKHILTIPFTHVLKNDFRMPHPSIILCGEGGTLKSSAGEMAVAIWGNHNNDIAENIVGGGELNSEYRFGRIMDCSSYPLVVNEPEVLFIRAKIRELIKDSVDGRLLRKPGSYNSKEYYSRRASIYCMNAVPQQADDPSYLRRFVTIDFTKAERGDTEEVKNRLQFLNKKGIINNGFEELSVIGDYVFYLISENINWLKLPLETLQNKIIEKMANQTGISLDWLLDSDIKTSVYIDRTDQENSILSLILTLLRDPYYKNKNKFINNSDPESILRNLVTDSNYYPYIHETVDGDAIVIDIGLKNMFNFQYGSMVKPITLSSIFNHLEDTTYNLASMKLGSQRVIGMKHPIRGIKMDYSEFTRLITNQTEE